jgi:hypothetical protein
MIVYMMQGSLIRCSYLLLGANLKLSAALMPAPNPTDCGIFAFSNSVVALFRGAFNL